MTSVSNVDICNDAMALFGHDFEITSLDPEVDRSAETLKCARLLPVARRHIFSKHPWSFLTQSPQAAGLLCQEIAPLPGYGAVYAIPANVIKIIGAIDSTGRHLGYMLADGVLHTKEQAGRLFYTTDEPQAERWSHDAVVAVTAELAYRLCRVMLPKSGPLLESLRADAADQLRASQVADNSFVRRNIGKPAANPYMQARR